MKNTTYLKTVVLNLYSDTFVFIFAQPKSAKIVSKYIEAILIAGIDSCFLTETDSMSELITKSDYGEHKTNALISHILVVIGLFIAIPSLIGAVWAMLKKKSAQGSLYHSHLVKVTRIFW